jgi:putative peptidoglycan lipid II flippase
MRKFFLSTTLFTGIGRSLGMLVPFFIAYFYGVGGHTDSFFLAYGVVNFILGVFVQLFESAIVPYLAEEKAKSRSMGHYANRVYYQIAPWVFGLSVLAWLAFPLLFKSNPYAHEVSLSFLFLIPFLMLGIWSSALNGIFFADKIFWFPSMSPAIRSLMVLISLVLFHKNMGVYAVCLGFVVGEALRWIIGFAALRKKEKTIKANDVPPRTQEFLKAAVLQIIALAAMSIVYFIDLLFASRLGTGSVSLLNYADRLLQVPYLLVYGGILQVFHSFWSEDYQRLPFAQVFKGIQNNIKLVFILATAFAGLLWISRDFIVWIFYGHGELSELQLHSMATVFGFLSFGFS